MSNADWALLERQTRLLNNQTNSADETYYRTTVVPGTGGQTIWQAAGLPAKTATLTKDQQLRLAKAAIPMHRQGENLQQKNRFSFALSAGEPRQIFERVAKDVEAETLKQIRAVGKNRFPPAEINRLTDGLLRRDASGNVVRGSREMIALFSLQYNISNKFPETIKAALRGDRARMYFEIVYRTNPSKAGKRSLGIAKRRLREGQFVLPGVWTGEEVGRFDRALKANAGEIGRYETAPELTPLFTGKVSPLNAPAAQPGMEPPLGFGDALSRAKKIPGGSTRLESSDEAPGAAAPATQIADSGAATAKPPAALRPAGPRPRTILGGDVEDGSDAAGAAFTPTGLSRANREALGAELGFDVSEAERNPRRNAQFQQAAKSRLLDRPGFDKLPGNLREQLGRLAAALTPNIARKALETGLRSLDLPPEMGGAAAPPRLSVDQAIGRDGISKVRQAIAVSGLRQTAKAVKDRRVVGRDVAPSFMAVFDPLLSAPPAAGPDKNVRKAVAVTQGVTNDAMSRAGRDDRLKIDGDFGPKTSEAVTMALDSAGTERFTDEVAKRLKIGPDSLLGNERRGFLG